MASHSLPFALPSSASFLRWIHLDGSARDYQGARQHQDLTAAVGRISAAHMLVKKVVFPHTANRDQRTQARLRRALLFGRTVPAWTSGRSLRAHIVRAGSRAVCRTASGW